MTPQEHIDKAGYYLTRAAAAGICWETTAQVNALAALAHAHAATASALLSMDAVAS